MLRLIDKTPREESEVFNDLVNLLKKVDGFVVLMINKGQVEVAKFNLSPMEIVYVCEYAKSEIFNGESFE
jgi:hypothetical protein